MTAKKIETNGTATEELNARSVPRARPSASSKQPKPTKKAQLSGLLARRKGATIAQIEAALDWQPHTIRAAISGLRKAGAEVSLERGGKVPAYRLVPAAE